jgi:alkylation response protein AidB-like acyl-CoA dehydrogenase
VAEAHVLQLVSSHLVERLSAGMASGASPPASGSIMKLFGATSVMRRAEIGQEIGGADTVVWPAGADTVGRALGEYYPMRQGMSLGGGSNEIQRNIISERVLGMPREWAADREVAFRDVRRNTMPTSPR